MSETNSLNKYFVPEAMANIISDSAITLSQSLSQDSDAIARQLKSYFRESVHSSPKDCYDKAFAAFSERYTLPNLAKNRYVLDQMFQYNGFRPPRKIVDIGSGPGTFTLSYLSWLCAWNLGSDCITDILMLDATPEFFDLFDRIWNQLPTSHKRGINPVTISHFVDGDLSTIGAQPDLVVFSNSLAEMLCTPRVNRDALIQSLIDASVPIIIIDYPYPQTLQLLNQFTSDLLESHFRLNRRHVSALADLESVNLGTISIPCNSRRNCSELRSVEFVYSVLEPRPASFRIRTDLAEVLVRKYQEAWESHNCELLADVFTEDATYLEKRDKEPFRGLAAICDYWRENAQRQVHVKFTPRSIECVGNRIDVIWGCHFYRKDLKKWMHLDGTFQASVRNGKIAAFTEEFSKKLADAPGISPRVAR